MELNDQKTHPIFPSIDKAVFSMSFLTNDCGWHEAVTCSFMEWKEFCSSLQPLENDVKCDTQNLWKHSRFLVGAKAVVVCGVLNCLSTFVKEFYDCEILDIGFSIWTHQVHYRLYTMTSPLKIFFFLIKFIC